MKHLCSHRLCWHKDLLTTSGMFRPSVDARLIKWSCGGVDARQVLHHLYRTRMYQSVRTTRTERTGHLWDIVRTWRPEAGPASVVSGLFSAAGPVRAAGRLSLWNPLHLQRAQLEVWEDAENQTSRDEGKHRAAVILAEVCWCPAGPSRRGDDQSAGTRPDQTGPDQATRWPDHLWNWV